MDKADQARLIALLLAENAELRRQVIRLSQALEKALREGIKISEE